MKPTAATTTTAPSIPPSTPPPKTARNVFMAHTVGLGADVGEHQGDELGRGRGRYLLRLREIAGQTYFPPM